MPSEQTDRLEETLGNWRLQLSQAANCGSCDMVSACVEVECVLAEIESLRGDADCGAGPAGCLNMRRQCASCALQEKDAQIERLRADLADRPHASCVAEVARVKAEMDTWTDSGFTDGMTKAAEIVWKVIGDSQEARIAVAAIETERDTPSSTGGRD